jgi:hypothetical protein
VEKITLNCWLKRYVREGDGHADLAQIFDGSSDSAETNVAGHVRKILPWLARVPDTSEEIADVN